MKDDSKVQPEPLSLWVKSLLGLVAGIPAIIVVYQIIHNTANIAYGDEFETVLDFIIKLSKCDGWGERFGLFFSIQNEHYIVVSRLLFALSYFIFGKVDFVWYAIIGNLWLIGVFIILITSTRDSVKRWWMMPILALLFFNLQHHENFFWSGSSIDHFLVVMLSVLALRLFRDEGHWRLFGACVVSILASFTLAHGLLVFPIAFIWLLLQKRNKSAIVVGIVGALVATIYALNFSLNSGHNIGGQGVWGIVWYWFGVLGSTPALGNATLKPLLGIILCGLFMWIAPKSWRMGKSHFVVYGIWAMLALLLIAIGRSAVDVGAPTPSRYKILSSLAWALVSYLVISYYLSDAERSPWRLKPAYAILGLLVCINCAEASRFWDNGAEFTQRRSEALYVFNRDGKFDATSNQLFRPDPDRAAAILKEAKKRGIYSPPAFCTPQPVPKRIKDSGSIRYFFDTITVENERVRIRGWAFDPAFDSKRVKVLLSFRGLDGREYCYQTFKQTRPDVAAAVSNEFAVQCGFRFFTSKVSLPRGSYQIGLVLIVGNQAFRIPTDHKVDFAGPSFVNL